MRMNKKGKEIETKNKINKNKQNQMSTQQIIKTKNESKKSTANEKSMNNDKSISKKMNNKKNINQKDGTASLGDQYQWLQTSSRYTQRLRGVK